MPIAANADDDLVVIRGVRLCFLLTSGLLFFDFFLLAFEVRLVLDQYLALEVDPILASEGTEIRNM
jgi:hypothetical protein